jgi:hypothetical protein
MLPLSNQQEIIISPPILKKEKREKKKIIKKNIEDFALLTHIYFLNRCLPKLKLKLKKN